MGDKAATHPRGYWTEDNSINVRKFFDCLAFEKQRDPLVAESWYDISWKEIADRGVCWFMCYSFSFFFFQLIIL